MVPFPIVDEVFFLKLTLRQDVFRRVELPHNFRVLHSHVGDPIFCVLHVVFQSPDAALCFAHRQHQVRFEATAFVFIRKYESLEFLHHLVVVDPRS